MPKTIAIGDLDEPVYRNLDHLAGTWTAEEAEEFRKATKPFSRVDEDLWRDIRSSLPVRGGNCRRKPDR